MMARGLSPECLLDPEFHASGNAHKVWQWMRENAPTYWHPQSDLPGFWSITRHDDICAVYGNPKVFSSAHGVLLRLRKHGDDPAGGLTIALTDPPRHKQLRAIISSWFTMPYARSLENLIRDKTKSLIAEARELGDFDFTQSIAARIPLYITCHILGVPEEDNRMVFNWAHEAFEAGKSLAAHSPFMLYFGDFMEKRMSNPGDDLASALIHKMVDSELLAEDEILLNFENLLGATENAGLSMAGGVLAFLEHPDSWKMLQENNELVSPAIEEILRWSSSATHSMRTVTEAITINGKELKPHDRVVLWLPSANRDEQYFNNPYIFDITRHPNRHIALGYGEHFCIGNALARVQIRVLLSELLGMNQTLELTAKPVPLSSIHVNGPRSLAVRFTCN